MRTLYIYKTVCRVLYCTNTLRSSYRLHKITSVGTLLTSIEHTVSLSAKVGNSSVNDGIVKSLLVILLYNGGRL